MIHPSIPAFYHQPLALALPTALTAYKNFLAPMLLIDVAREGGSRVEQAVADQTTGRPRSSGLRLG